VDARGTSSHFFCLSASVSAILSSEPTFPTSPTCRTGAVISLRSLLILTLVALVGCTSEDIHAPQKFFPGSRLTNWDECSKFGEVGNEVAICASTGLIPGAASPSYNIQFALPAPVHVRIAAFDEHAKMVKLLLDQDEPATLQGQFRQPPVSWDFTDESGHRVPEGDYRLYFQAGDFTSTSDVPVE